MADDVQDDHVGVQSSDDVHQPEAIAHVDLAVAEVEVDEANHEGHEDGFQRLDAQEAIVLHVVRERSPARRQTALCRNSSNTTS